MRVAWSREFKGTWQYAVSENTFTQIDQLGRIMRLIGEY